jgi:hypothetical protein
MLASGPMSEKTGTRVSISLMMSRTGSRTTAILSKIGWMKFVM